MDFRMTDDFADHPKVERLARTLGDGAVRGLLRVWGYAARNRPDGRLTGLSDDDVEGIARWSTRRKGRFTAVLLDLRFLERNGADLIIHDWLQHQPFLADREFRTARATKAARTRWNRHAKSPGTDEVTLLAACPEHATGMLSASPSNAQSNARIDPDRSDPSLRRESAPKGRKRKPETTWPEGFVLTDDLRAYAVKHKCDADHEFEKFRLHAIDKSPTHTNWSVAFQRWIQNAVSYREERNGQGKGNAGTAMPTAEEYWGRQK